MTKSSIEYHYKRLNHARKGPQVYRKKPDLAGGGAYYHKIACEGPQGSKPPSKNEIEARKKQLIDSQIKIYNEGIKDNDPRFNLCGGTFKGAVTVKSNLQTIALPDQGIDQKRLKQKNLHGLSFDQKFSAIKDGIHQRMLGLTSEQGSYVGRSHTLDTSFRARSLNETSYKRAVDRHRTGDSTHRPDESH